MSDVTIYHADGRDTIQDPEHVNCLMNVDDVAVDGELFQDVSQVEFNE